LIIEAIWDVRNQVVHNNTKPNILSIVRALEKRIMEHSLVVEFKKAVATMSDFRREKPPLGVW
jgi:hypothetical protein